LSRCAAQELARNIELAEQTVALDSSYVKRLSRKLRKFLKKKNRALPPVQVHKFRTHLRHVEAAAEALIPKAKRRDKAVLKDIRRIRKQAGKVRDMDVLTADVTSIRVPANQKDELISLLEYLGSQRYREAKRLRSLLRIKGPRLRKGMKQFGIRLQERLKHQQQASENGAFPEVMATTLQLWSYLKRPPRLALRTLHPHRLNVKKLRDVVRLSDRDNHSKLAGSLDQVKDAIGDWHDWQELARLAGEVLEESRGVLSKAVVRTAQQRYVRALSLTEGMRRRLLHPRNASPPQSIVKTAEMAN
jgi:CHAD domain-containing protein